MLRSAEKGKGSGRIIKSIGGFVLQIIGWIGCLYLVVKAFEIISSNEHRNAEGKLHTAGMVAAIIALLGALIFVLLLEGQVSNMP